MDEPTVTPSTENPAATPPPTISAEMDAVGKGDFAAFRVASDAARAGKRPDPVPVTPAAKTDAVTAGDAPKVDATEPKTTSKRQEDINERIRVAVEKAVGDARTQWEASHRQPPPAAAKTEPDKPKEPAYKRFLAMPDAPKLDQFESLEEHSAAMGLFMAERLMDERMQAAAVEQRDQQLTAAQTARVDGFVKQLHAAKSDPEFVGKLSAEVRALKPFDALLPGESGGPLNIIAEQIYDSPIVDKVLIALSADGNKELTRLSTAPAHVIALPPAARAEAHIRWIVKEFNKLEARLESATTTPAPAPPAAPANPLSSAPPPVETLKPGETGDPLKAAIARGDMGAFHKLETAKRIAKMQGR